MDNLIFFTSEIDKTEWVSIHYGNEQYTSMLKSTYDELKANEAAKTI